MDYYYLCYSYGPRATTAPCSDNDAKCHTAIAAGETRWAGGEYSGAETEEILVEAPITRIVTEHWCKGGYLFSLDVSYIETDNTDNVITVQMLTQTGLQGEHSIMVGRESFIARERDSGRNVLYCMYHVKRQ